jgi:acetolactate synthase regulatory subunit
MAPTTFALQFSITRGNPISTLEAVLSHARRGGLALASVTFTEGAHEDRATMRIRCGDADRIYLFLTRLGKVIDVSDVVVRPQ